MACFYGDKITRVSFAGIDHTDAACTTDTDGKKDFTGSVAPGVVAPGQSYALSVTVENSLSSGTERLRAWIDHNRDGVFEAGESIDLGTATGNATVSVTVAIPSDAVPGLTRMRIMYRRTQSNPLNAGDACHSYGSYRGQVKDYALRIEPLVSLPVQLLAFTLQARPEGVQLAWTTASEASSDHFTVEHSLDLEQWEVLAVVPGAGDSNSILHYSYTHAAVSEGTHYYRLRQIDINGRIRDLPLRSIYVERFDQPVPYPDPCTDHVRLRLDGADPRFTVRSTSGQVQPVMAVRCGANEWEFDTRSIPAGIYIIHLHDQGRVRYARFVKQ